MNRITLNFCFGTIIVVFALGCSNSYSVNQYEELTLPENAFIYLRDGKILSVSNAEIKQDSVHATEFYSGEVVHLDASAIHQITLKRSNAKKYSLMGAAGAMGWVVLTQGSWNNDNNPGYTFYWSAIFGGIGAGAGFLVGSMQTDEHIIRFKSNEEQNTGQANP
mgnify:CR=1 FL=1